MCFISHILLVVFEVRLMKKYDLLLDGIPISVISEGVTERRVVADTVCDGGYAVIVSPCECADFSVTCIDKNNLELREPYLFFMALSCFFKTVRGFPDITLDVLYRGDFYEMPIDDGEKKFTVNVGKCKILCTKTVEFDDGIAVSVDVINCGYPCACVLCRDSELFSWRRLSEITSLLGMGRDTSVIAASFDENLRIRCCGAIPYYSAVAVALSSLVNIGTVFSKSDLVASVNGREHSFSYSHGNLTFYPNIKYLY